jgi:chromosome segregation protein
MLKRLELVGFKSFADKTQFDFPPGVTGIIGPNGSGKSNVVDAVRWVLGEQSAKSLRGGEMTDVIFNGAAGRRSLGLAEVVMTFDNTRRSLAIEAEEVQIGRRVYRNGEGEYLINGHVSRLKDVKDLFLGSGAGSDAYCIIEQGRVDVLLQASTKERRTIFEEAAGISRFKVKKIETLRRLERVDLNLQRLRDILDEVEKQLRSVKLQASKAQRFQEYSERLKELRVALSLVEYQRLSDKLDAEGLVLEQLRATLAEQAKQADAWDFELQSLEHKLARHETVQREREAEAAAAQREIDAAQSTLTHEWALTDDLEAELTETRHSLAALDRRVVELAAAVDRASAEWRAAEAQGEEQRRTVQGLEARLRETETHLSDLQMSQKRDKDAHMDCMRQAARAQNDVVSYKAQVDNLTRERGRLLLRSEQATEHLASLDLELEELTAGDEALQGKLTAARQTLADLRGERERLGAERDQAAQAAADLRAQRSGLASRIEVLEGLERSHEGLNAGAREVFAHLEQLKPGPWRTVIGILADFLTVRREFAPLIDLALGERAQRFLVEDAAQLTRALRERGQPFSGRVSFLPLDEKSRKTWTPTQANAATDAEVAAHPGVVALAEKVVRCDDPRLADLPVRLLGRTLIVRDLATAKAVAALGPGFRCVTLQGELLEPDGALTVGAHHAETGILSRKSELRELREQAATMELRVAELEHALNELKEQAHRLDGREEDQEREVQVLAEQAADLRSRLGQHRRRREGLHEEVALSQSELTGLEQEIQRLEQSLEVSRGRAAEAEAQVQALHVRLEEADRDIRAGEDARQQAQQETLKARVALAQVEERLSALAARHRQVEVDLRQRRQEQAQGEQRRDQTQLRLQDCQRELLTAYAALAEQHPRKEQADRARAAVVVECERLRTEKQQRAEQAHVIRSSWRVQQEQAHARELEVNDLRHHRDAICARLREDYQLELADLYQRHREETTGGDAAPPALAEQEAAAEIEELRRKLSRLGSVNLDAIQELAELEARASTLQIQFDDLTAAAKRLQEIIDKINGDSRKLFMETFAVIRGNFQELFRKLFGGGMADVVLEDESDVLESGIEVIARPPGKELRSISLMSGGEKTLTAVALLLAIFRSKPSPFCILDEVDAALDEANIGRFTNVLRDFLDRSQFIIVTHSKRTMACADVLYGVTMLESGVSKRMAVRFEDWPDDERPQDQPAA